MKLNTHVQSAFRLRMTPIPQHVIFMCQHQSQIFELRHISKKIITAFIYMNVQFVPCTLSSSPASLLASTWTKNDRLQQTRNRSIPFSSNMSCYLGSSKQHMLRKICTSNGVITAACYDLNQKYDGILNTKPSKWIILKQFNVGNYFTLKRILISDTHL